MITLVLNGNFYRLTTKIGGADRGVYRYKVSRLSKVTCVRGHYRVVGPLKRVGSATANSSRCNVKVSLYRDLGGPILVIPIFRDGIPTIVSLAR